MLVVITGLCILVQEPPAILSVTIFALEFFNRNINSILTYKDGTTVLLGIIYIFVLIVYVEIWKKRIYGAPISPLIPFGIFVF